MDFTLSDKQVFWRDRVGAFMDEHIYPAVPGNEALETKARPAGLWNLFLPTDSSPDDSPWRGAGLTNLDGAVGADEKGKVGFAGEAFNCSAPDTGNMEVLARHGSPAQQATDVGQAKRHASLRTLRLADGPDEVHHRTIARIEDGKHRAPKNA